ncbi:high-potential iron-sulfur protein [Frateuria aurantia]
MSELTQLKSRRRFLGAAGSLGVTALGLGLLPVKASAADLPHVTDADATAKALSYVADAGKSANPARKPNTDCSSCQFYSGPKGKGFGPCQMFPGKSVSAVGWCQAYSAR